ncbi:hypothetical protein RSP799_16755 [Ralstonia solanacearum]|nr:hypothetical protein RSP799_16755 [Ralstonia solanacearum]
MLAVKSSSIFDSRPDIPSKTSRLAWSMRATAASKLICIHARCTLSVSRPEADKVKQAGFIGIAIAALALFAPAAYAEEWSEPDYNGPPERFYQDAQATMLSGDPPGKRNVKNTFAIGHEDAQGMPFYIYVSGQNLHVCSVSGHATAVAPAEWVFKSLTCEIKFRRQGRNAMRVSATLDCDNQFCALPASFGSRVFLGK